MHTQPSVDTEPLRFRAPTLDEAIELAEQSLGARARVVAANHIRRGGIGGFFASDLGVEVSVVIEDETIEEALARIAEEAATRERAQWRERGDADEYVPDTTPTFADAARMVDRQTAMAGVDRFEPAAAVTTTGYPAWSTRHPVRAEVPQSAVPEAESSPAAGSFPPAVAPNRSGTQLASRVERMEAAFASLRASQSAPSPTPRAATTAPTRRQVELAVAAADQLMSTISCRASTRHISVRVVLRGSTGSEVEAHTTWGIESEVRS